MHRRLENRQEGTFWHIELVDEQVLEITEGAIGTEGEVTIIEDSYDDHGLPPEELLEELLQERLGQGYEEVPIDDLLKRVETGHGVKLKGRLKSFFAKKEYKEHHGKLCRTLDCRVSFLALSVQGLFDEEYFDPDGDSQIKLIPLAAKVMEDGYVEEQQWIGVDPSMGNGPIYELFTSGEYEVAYENLDEFLEDLE